MKISVTIDSPFLGIQQREDMENELQKFHQDSYLSNQNSNQPSMAGLYRVKSGSYKEEHVEIFEIRYYYEYCSLNKEPKLKWFTYLAYLLAYDQIQGFVPWALELMTPVYAQKGGNKNYLP